MRWKYLQRANYGEAQVVRNWSCPSVNCKNHSQRTMSSLGFLNTMRMTLCWLLTLIRVLGLWNLFHTQSPQIAGDWRFSERISGGDKSSLLMLMMLMMLMMPSLTNIHLTQTTQNQLTVHQELLMSHWVMSPSSRTPHEGFAQRKNESLSETFKGKCSAA